MTRSMFSSTRSERARTIAPAILVVCAVLASPAEAGVRSFLRACGLRFARQQLQPNSPAATWIPSSAADHAFEQLMQWEERSNVSIYRQPSEPFPLQLTRVPLKDVRVLRTFRSSPE